MHKVLLYKGLLHLVPKDDKPYVVEGNVVSSSGYYHPATGRVHCNSIALDYEVVILENIKRCCQSPSLTQNIALSEARAGKTVDAEIFCKLASDPAKDKPDDKLEKLVESAGERIDEYLRGISDEKGTDFYRDRVIGFNSMLSTYDHFRGDLGKNYDYIPVPTPKGLTYDALCNSARNKIVKFRQEHNSGDEREKRLMHNAMVKIHNHFCVGGNKVLTQLVVPEKSLVLVSEDKHKEVMLELEEIRRAIVNTESKSSGVSGVSFLADLTYLINHHSIDSHFNDPDYMIAEYLEKHLNLYNCPKTVSPFDEFVSEFKKLLDQQLSDGNWNYSAYMHGMANAFILVDSLIQKKEPEYLSEPKNGYQVDSGTMPMTETSLPVGWERIAKDLWMLLDDIDTATDWTRGDTKAFTNYVIHKIKSRENHLHSMDGQTLERK